MIKTRSLRLAVGLLAAALLASCGGGDGDGGTAATAAPSAGLWTGTMDTQRNFTAVTLSDGRYYMIYDQANAPTAPGGMIDGTDPLTYPTFTSMDARDYRVETLFSTGVAGSVTATLQPHQSFAGSVSRANNTTSTFTTTYDPDFETLPTRTAIAGTYTGTLTFTLGARTAQFVVSPTGTVSSSLNGCTIGGHMDPRQDGNVYELRIDFGPDPCVFPNQSLRGIAYYRAANGQLRTATSGVVAMSTNPPFTGLPLADGVARPQGVVFFGNRTP